MKKYILKDDTMDELKKVYNSPTYLRNSITPTNKGFVNIDDGSKGRTYWTCFYIKDSK